MNARHLAAFGLMAPQVAGIMLISGLVWPPLVCLAIAAASLFTPYRKTLTGVHSVIIIAIWVVLTGALARSPLFEPVRALPTLFNYDYHRATVYAVCLLFSQSLLFWLRLPGDPSSPPRLFPLFGMLGLTCLGDFYTSDVHIRRYAVCAVAFAFLTPFYMGISREQGSGPRRYARHVWSLGILVLAILVGWQASVLLRQYGGAIDTWFMMHATMSTRQGFSRDASLGSVADTQTQDSERIALRVMASEPPGYLRGTAYERFEAPGMRRTGAQSARWLPAQEKVTLLPVPNARFDEAPSGVGMAAFHLRKDGAPPYRALEIWPRSGMQGAMFSTLDTCWVIAALDRLGSNAHGIPETVGVPPPDVYAMLCAPQGPAALEAHERRRLLQIPAGLDPRIEALARELEGGSIATVEKITTVEKYFHENYTYKFGITVPIDKDPMTWFLLEKPPAHCEYFASGAAILLRLMDVPCRYMGGFLAVERHPAGYYIARNRDAHAWVEAYDAEDGSWVTVEATPSSGMPETRATGWFSAAWDSLLFRIQKLGALLRDGLSIKIAPELLSSLSAFLLVLIRPPWGFIPAGVLLWFISRKIRRAWSPRARVDPELRALHAALATMDRAATRRRFTRRPSETMTAFASRLRETGHDDAASSEWRVKAAQWYETYAVCRFGGLAEAEEVAREGKVIARG